MTKRSKYEKFNNSLKKRLEGLSVVYNSFVFFPKKINEFQKYDNLKLYIDSENLFLNNIDISNGKFLRYDIILNYMGIKGIKDRNYKFLEIAKNFINIEMLEKELINNNNDQPLLISSSENIIEKDAFRLAVALYKKQKTLYVKYDLKEKSKVNYNFNWLKKNFSDDNIAIILEEYRILRETFYPQTNMIVWAPAHKYLKSIKNEISKKSYITKEITIEFKTQDELKHFLEKIYCGGNNVFGRVEQKWNRIKDEELKIIVLWVETNLNRREKGFSTDIVQLKKKIRNKIKKKMKNYVFDSVIHMGGNIGEILELNEVLDQYIK